MFAGQPTSHSRPTVHLLRRVTLAFVSRLRGRTLRALFAACLICAGLTPLALARSASAPRDCRGFAQAVAGTADLLAPERALCAPDGQTAQTPQELPLTDVPLILDMGLGNELLDLDGPDLIFYEWLDGPGIRLDLTEVAVSATGEPDSYRTVFIWGDSDSTNNGSVPAGYARTGEIPERVIMRADLTKNGGIAIDIGSGDGASYRFVRLRAHLPAAGVNLPQNPRVEVDAVESVHAAGASLVATDTVQTAQAATEIAARATAEAPTASPHPPTETATPTETPSPSSTVELLPTETATPDLAATDLAGTSTSLALTASAQAAESATISAQLTAVAATQTADAEIIQAGLLTSTALHATAEALRQTENARMATALSATITAAAQTISAGSFTPTASPSPTAPSVTPTASRPSPTATATHTAVPEPVQAPAPEPSHTATATWEAPSPTRASASGAPFDPWSTPSSGAGTQLPTADRAPAQTAAARQTLIAATNDALQDIVQMTERTAAAQQAEAERLSGTAAAIQGTAAAIATARPTIAAQEGVAEAAQTSFAADAVAALAKQTAQAAEQGVITNAQTITALYQTSTAQARLAESVTPDLTPAPAPAGGTSPGASEAVAQPAPRRITQIVQGGRDLLSGGADFVSQGAWAICATGVLLFVRAIPSMLTRTINRRVYDRYEAARKKRVFSLRSIEPLLAIEGVVAYIAMTCSLLAVFAIIIIMLPSSIVITDSLMLTGLALIPIVSFVWYGWIIYDNLWISALNCSPLEALRELEHCRKDPQLIGLLDEKLYQELPILKRDALLDLNLDEKSIEDLKVDLYGVIIESRWKRAIMGALQAEDRSMRRFIGRLPLVARLRGLGRRQRMAQRAKR